MAVIPTDREGDVLKTIYRPIREHVKYVARGVHVVLLND